MKKVLIAAAIISINCMYAHAQGNKVVSAKMHLDEYNKDQDSNALRDAKTAIDEAAQNEKTKDEPKMFLYRGDVYQALYNNQVSVLATKLMQKGKNMDAKALQQAFQEAQVKASLKADTSYILTAVNSYEQVIQLAPKDFYAEEAKHSLLQCSVTMENIGIAAYNNQNPKEALVFFEKTFTLAKNQGISDTAQVYIQMLQYTAMAAYASNDYAKTATYYGQMIDLKAGGAMPYKQLAKMYLDEKDTNKSYEMVQKGRAAYPDDIDLLISETNIYMWRHDNDKAIADLQTIIGNVTKKNDPKEKDLLGKLYAALGGIYDKMANPRDAQNKDLPKPANYDDLFNKAEASYKSSLAIDSNSFETNFNIGALFTNRSNYLFRQIAALSDKDQATKGKAMDDEAKLWLKKAQPYLEKAHTINPTDASAKKALLGLYASTGQDDKAKALAAEH